MKNRINGVFIELTRKYTNPSTFVSYWLDSTKITGIINYPKAKDLGVCPEKRIGRLAS